MNRLSGIRIFRSWIKVRIVEPLASGLHSKPPKEPPAPSQDEADENSTKPATTKFRAGSPEDRARRSETMKGVWARPGVREERLALMRKAWSNMSPEAKKKHSAAIKEGMSLPERKARASESRKRVWNQPGYKEKRRAAILESWSPERSEKVAAISKAMWDNKPENRAIFASRLEERWKISENKDAFLRNKIFRRDDDNPKMKDKWEKMGTISRTDTVGTMLTLFVVRCPFILETGFGKASNASLY